MNTRDQIENFFSKVGLLSSRFDNFEFRKSQSDMAVAIWDTLTSKQHIFIEAPTGIGKSFAYLVPAIYYAITNGKKAIISTHTINLQEQLLHKDLPILQNILPIKFKAGLIKGKNNYICPKRLRRAMENSNILFEEDERLLLERINNWSKNTNDGTISDINFPINYNVWKDVCSERGICTNKTCGSYEETECFYQKAKYKISKSDVAIVNHHLFFTLFDYGKDESDKNKGYLYSNDFLIFDEAQSIETVASEHLIPALSREAIKYNLLKLYNPNKKKGFLLSFSLLHIVPIIQNLLELNYYFFNEIKNRLFFRKSDRPEKLTVRVHEKNFIENLLKDEIEHLIDKLKELRKECRSDMEENELNDYILKFAEFNYYLDGFLGHRENSGKNPNFVYWVELSSQKEDANISLCTSPIDVSEYFRDNIFTADKTCILTSATLTVNQSFDYFKKRLGAEQIKELRLPTQFDFYNQVQIYIPKEIPMPQKDSNTIFKEKLAEWILYFINLTGGKALVLFTNFSLMLEIGNQIKDILGEKNIELLLQNKGISIKMLLQKFKDNTNSVLFGLESFWVGIDVPGESLSNLIITRLPFQVPDHPLIQARIEFIDVNGGNSFMDYSLPEAILKFRQGIGRLIRNKTDTGIIAILDNRIIYKQYGKFFLNSIDECPVKIL